MDAITMPNNTLLSRLISDHPLFHFKEAANFAWSADHQTIFWSSSDPAHLLHELGHALLSHAAFTRDIELLGMERDAWQKARQLANHYDITISTDTIEDDLDTYREWLHARSTCPVCEMNGIQIAEHLYECIMCAAKWRVNDARICGLKRTLIHK